MNSQEAQMAYDPLLRWENEGGATLQTEAEKSAPRSDEGSAERPPPQGWIRPRRIA
jgi:hypothetical protein